MFSVSSTPSFVTPTVEASAEIPDLTGLIAAVPGDLVHSADSAVVFGSLARLVARHTGAQCTVELVNEAGLVLIEAPSALTQSSDTPLEAVALSPVTRELLAGDGQPLIGDDWVAVPIGVVTSLDGTAGQFPVGAFMCRFPNGPAGEAQAGLVRLLVAVASGVLEAENRLLKSQDQVRHLEIALASNRDIGTAIGILMTRHLLAQDQAFTMLRVASQHSHRKLREIASDVIFTGALDAPAPAPSGKPAQPARPAASS